MALSCTAFPVKMLKFMCAVFDRQLPWERAVSSLSKGPMACKHRPYAGRNVALWHLADMPERAPDVRFWR
jgi:hypothetical protein